MTADRYARLAGKVLLSADDVAPGPSPEERERAIAAIEGALRAKRRRLAAKRVAGGLAVAAAVAAAAALVVGRHGGAPASSGPVARSTVAPTPVLAPGALSSGEGDTAVEVPAPAGSVRVIDSDGVALAPGSRIVARPRGHAILAFATGTRLTVEDGGDVTLVDDGPQAVVAVSHGSMRAVVTGLREGERFVVRTGDAELDVVGSFRVAADAAPCGGASTRVQVESGRVIVRHAGGEERVDAGDSWPRGCSAGRPTAHAAQAPASLASPASPASAPVSASSLAEQNDLFASAVAAKGAGDARVAVERFESFARKYPGSPLAENAAAERMRLLRGLDPARAKVAARAYITRWPDGFARSEAEGILSGAR